MTLTIGGVTSRPIGEGTSRMAMLIWGPPGIGKTTLAMTAPGRKIHLCFDHDGYLSVNDRTDVEVVDLSQFAPSSITQFKNASPLSGLEQALKDDTFGTVVIDSLTAIEEKTLRFGIDNTPGASIERPSPGAYGARSGYTIELFRNALELSHKYNKHIIFLAHEAPPDRDAKGNIIAYPISLGGKLPNNLSSKINELWYLGENTEGKKRIAIRPIRMRSPMKTRMFLTSGPPEFSWNYNADTFEGDGIENWYERWKANGFKKVPVPDGKLPTEKGK